LDKQEAGQLSLDLLETAEAAILTTVDGEGFPQTRAMFNLRRKEQFPGLSPVFKNHQNDYLVYFTTNTSSPKVALISANPRVSVYYSKPGEFRGLMLGGVIEIVIDRAEKETIWQPGWERYYPGGAHDPDHTVLRLYPLQAKYYHQLQFFHFALRGAR
jgi:general stress protein 26